MSGQWGSSGGTPPSIQDVAKSLSQARSWGHSRGEGAAVTTKQVRPLDRGACISGGQRGGLGSESRGAMVGCQPGLGWSELGREGPPLQQHRGLRGLRGQTPPPALPAVTWARRPPSLCPPPRGTWGADAFLAVYSWESGAWTEAGRGPGSEGGPALPPGHHDGGLAGKGWTGGCMIRGPRRHSRDGGQKGPRGLPEREPWPQALAGGRGGGQGHSPSAESRPGQGGVGC